MSLPKKPDFDHDKIRQAVKLLFEAIGEDTNRPGIVETPDRVVSVFEELFEGCKYTNAEIAKYNTVLFDSPSKGIVIEKIEGPGLNGICEHHLLPMFDMTVYVGYIPHGKVIGLSKLSRIAELCAKRPSLQEKIGADIAECVQLATGTKDVAVIITAKHGCIQFRGAKKNVITKTVELRGTFLTDSKCATEFYELVKNL
ncbi:MAG: GTP cyclohydrolase I [Treponema sp.]|nr:GTP cyclohydrolase I [Treponema sp.]